MLSPASFLFIFYGKLEGYYVDIFALYSSNTAWFLFFKPFFFNKMVTTQVPAG